MSLGKKIKLQCPNDHICCSNLIKMERQVESLQLKLKNSKQDLQLSQSINTKLLKQLQEHTGRVDANYRVATNNNIDSGSILEVKNNVMIEQYEGRIKQLHYEINRITEDFNRKITFIEQKNGLKMEEYEHEKLKQKHRILDLEADIKNTKETVMQLEKQKRQLNKQVEQYRQTALNMQSLGRKAEAEKVSMQLQMTRIREAMNQMEKTNGVLSRQLMSEKQVRSQAMEDSRSKSQQLAKISRELREHSQGKQSLQEKNEELRGLVDCLDEYALEARQRQHVYRRKLLRAHNFGLAKTRTCSELRSTGYHF